MEVQTKLGKDPETEERKSVQSNSLHVENLCQHVEKRAQLPILIFHRRRRAQQETGHENMEIILSVGVDRSSHPHRCSRLPCACRANYAALASLRAWEKADIGPLVRNRKKIAEESIMPSPRK